MPPHPLHFYIDVGEKNVVSDNFFRVSETMTKGKNHGFTLTAIILLYNTCDMTIHPLRQFPPPFFSTTEREQTPSVLLMKRPQRDLPNAAGFVVCAHVNALRHNLEQLDSETRP